MKILLAGGTGFIGRRLQAELRRSGDDVTLLVRSGASPGHEGTRAVRWDGREGGEWERALEGADAVVNLAGAPIAGWRWTAARRELLRRSRIDPTRAIVHAIRRASRPPSVLINASAVGFYGDVPEGEVTEETPRGSGFLPELCAEWESTAMEAERGGVRVVALRTGIVLAAGEGAMARMVLPFRLFVGGPLGGARQWFPWIHAEDVVGSILFLIRGSVSGPVNIVAPHPVRMSEFARTLGAVLHRPSWLPVPSFFLRALLGDMARVVLEGQRAIPAKLLQNRYPFRHPELAPALRDLFP